MQENQSIITPNFSVKTISAHQLIESLKEKQVAIPTLQRQSVWDHRKRENFFCGLFDSELVGDIRTYQISDGEFDICDIPIPFMQSNVRYMPVDNIDVNYIADGGQRARTLYVCSQSDFNGYTMYIRITNNTPENKRFRMLNSNNSYKQAGKRGSERDLYLSFPQIYEFLVSDSSLTVEQFLNGVLGNHTPDSDMIDTIQKLSDSSFFKNGIIISSGITTMDKFFEIFKQCNLNSVKFKKADNLAHTILEKSDDIYYQFQDASISSPHKLDVNDLVWLCYMNKNASMEVTAQGKTVFDKSLKMSTSSEVIKSFDDLADTDIFINFIGDFEAYLNNEFRDTFIEIGGEEVNVHERLLKTSKYVFAMLQLHYWHNKNDMSFSANRNVVKFVKWVTATTSFQWSAKYTRMLQKIVENDFVFPDFTDYIDGSEGYIMTSVYRDV